MAGVWETRRHSLFGQPDATHGVTRTAAHSGVLSKIAQLETNLTRMCAVRPNDEIFTKALDVLRRCQTQVREVVQPATTVSTSHVSPAVNSSEEKAAEETSTSNTRLTR
jgi:hypothetical protein